MKKFKLQIFVSIHTIEVQILCKNQRKKIKKWILIRFFILFSFVSSRRMMCWEFCRLRYRKIKPLSRCFWFFQNFFNERLSLTMISWPKAKITQKPRIQTIISIYTTEWQYVCISLRLPGGGLISVFVTYRGSHISFKDTYHLQEGNLGLFWQIFLTRIFLVVITKEVQNVIQSSTCTKKSV